jgi:hypothetical protein
MNWGFLGSSPNARRVVENLALEHFGLDERIGPHSFEDLVLAHQSSGVLD